MANETDSPHDRVRRLALLIRQLRLERNLSQNKLAKRAHIGTSTLNQIERVADGKPLVGMPLPDTLRQLARGLATDYRGAVDTEAAGQLYTEMMIGIGYYNDPPPSVVTIPRVVLQRLAELSDAEVEFGLTGRPWTEQDTANVLRAVEEAHRRKRAQNSA